MLQPIAFIVYGFAKSAMFYAYAVVTIVVCIIISINIQPFKRTASRFHSTDTIFYILLSLFYTVLLGMEIEDRVSSLNSFIMVILAIVSASVPIAYILGLIGFWLFSVVKNR